MNDLCAIGVNRNHDRPVFRTLDARQCDAQRAWHRTRTSVMSNRSPCLSLLQCSTKILGRQVSVPEQAKFPKGVRSITIDEMDNLGVEDTTGKLYWGANELQVKKVVSLRWYELTLATLASVSALGVFLLELLRFYFDV